MKFKTIEWKKDSVRILDQRRLPNEVRYLECRSSDAVAQAIRTLAVRGAPAIGIAAAMGIALAAMKLPPSRPETFGKRMASICELMRQTRPTAVNLFWAVDRMKKILDRTDSINFGEVRKRLEKEALLIYEEDIAINRKIGERGKVLIQEGDGVLTHCNAGALATAGHGTALGILYSAWAEGRRFEVFADETRPLLQGARLTAWELIQKEIPVTLITDSMAAALMKRGKINLVLVGADRIARNGDTANKIGTYGLAILARWHRIPFYVAAPLSTLDFRLSSGAGIPIEERAPEEVTHFHGKRVTSKKVRVFNPAFDVTPHGLIEGIITEKGIIRKPYERNLQEIGGRAPRFHDTFHHHPAD
jgi:methylthioribose-1-phosphate isomerase